MAHIAVMTTGLTGILHSSFEVVSRLEAEGHKVTYLCPWDVREKVEGMGFTYVQLPKINFKYWNAGNSSLKSWPIRLIHHFRNIKSKNRLGKETLGYTSLKQKLKEVNADRAIIDVELHELIYSAIELNLPFILMNQWFPNLKGPNIPPIESDTIPGAGFMGSTLGVHLAWAYKRNRVFLRNIGSSVFVKNYRRRVLKMHAKELKMPVSSLKYSFFPPLFHYKHLPTFHMVMQEMDFPHSVPETVRYGGPFVFDKRDNKQMDQATLGELSRIFSSCENNGNKLIYCMVSTLNKGDTIFIKKVIKAVAKVPDWQLIVSLGGKLKKDAFQSLNKNIHIFEWVPQLMVLEHADCNINHAGINTINECVHYNVPMLVYSGKRHDQNGCAARVAYHNVGIVGDKDKDTSEIIREKIKRIFNDEIYANKMAEMNSKYRINKEKSLTNFLQ